MLYISRYRKTCEVASFKNFENSLTIVKVMTETKVAPFYLGQGVDAVFLTGLYFVLVQLVL